MAQLHDKLADGKMLLRILAYGPAKSKKTWWAAKAAEAGFRVHLLDGDNGWQILKNIDKSAQHLIEVIDLVDKTKDAVFAVAMTQLLKDGKLLWNENTKASAKLKPENATVNIDLANYNHEDILVVDSWTALVWSLVMRYSKENGIDLTDPEKADREFYGWGNSMTKWMLNQLQSLPCHVIVIGHSTVYEKYENKGKGKPAELVMQRRQPVSTSGPNAMQMASKFSDVLYFSVKGSSFKIDVDGDNDKDGGSRGLPPKVYNWADLQFKDVCAAYGIPLPSGEGKVVSDLPDPSTKPKSTGGVIEETTGKSLGLSLGKSKLNK